KQASEPKNNYVVVFEAGAYGANKTYGHVGIIKKVSSLDKKTWQITVKGANQGGKTSTDASCNNVSEWKINVSKTANNMSYWKK
ncbi:CHAP domain containing protein, partial [Candidatus Magnetobacterium bavaricum]